MAIRKKPHKNKLARCKVGMKFGLLTVTRKVTPPKREHGKEIYGLMWTLQCDCGSKAFTTREGYLFRSTNPLTCCGCTKKGLPTLHRREYQSWTAMNSRCSYEGHVSWAAYGGRGISVCERWSNRNPEGFKNFLEDMGPRPDRHSIDRYPDNDGNYHKDNCRWATYSEQGYNKRLNTGPTPPIPEEFD